MADRAATQQLKFHTISTYSLITQLNPRNHVGWNRFPIFKRRHPHSICTPASATKTANNHKNGHGIKTKCSGWTIKQVINHLLKKAYEVLMDTITVTVTLFVYVMQIMRFGKKGIGLVGNMVSVILQLHSCTVACRQSRAVICCVKNSYTARIVQHMRAIQRFYILI